MSGPDLAVLASLLPAARALLDQVPETILLIQEDGAIAYVNPEGRSWFASAPGSRRPLAAGEVYLERWRELFPEDSAEVAAVDQGLRAILSGELASFQRDCPCGDALQTRWLSISISACQLAERRGALLRTHDLTAQWNRNEELADQGARLSLFTSLTSDALVLSENGVVLDCNEMLCRLLGYTREEIVGKPVNTMVAPQSRELVREHMLKNSDEPYEHFAIRKDGTIFEAAIVGRKLTYKGRTIRGTSICDLTTLKEAQRALGRAQEEKLHAQAALLAELSTPLIPLNNRALVMPLIGSIDSQRAQQVLQTLLTGIEQHRAAIVIIDITGVRVVDSHVASTLVRAAKASRLLGAQVVLTGIRAEVAHTLVRLGAQLDDLTTKATLQDGIAYAIAQNA